MTKQEILDYFKDINEVYNDCTRLDSLARMLNEVTASMEWIPVSERMPEEEGGYIAYYSYPDGKGHKFVGPCHYSIIGFDEKWSWTNAYGFKLDVSHWMPFPEPPKEN